jgi:hypothetical protein
MTNHLYRLEVRRTKKKVTLRAVGRGPRGHNFTLSFVEIPLAEYKQFMADGGMLKFLEPVAVGPRKLP